MGWLRRTLAALALLAALLLVTLVVLFTAVLPRAAPPVAVAVELTPERVARGRYLAEHVILCVNCHSERDWNLYSAPPMRPYGGGRECLEAGSESAGLDPGDMQFPGTACFRNVTPDPVTGIGGWTDGEVLRALREGVHRDGHALFPIMPYFIFRNLSDDDAMALVAWLRTLAPVANAQPPTDLDFPVNWLIRLLPRPVESVPHPDTSDPVARGEYLATIGRCAFCHTPQQGASRQPVPGRFFAGGVEFQGPFGTMRSPNLTPHPDGIGNLSRDDWIAMFRRHATPRAVTPADNTLMSWLMYAGMSDADLGAIYDYLLTLDPVASAP